MKVSFKTLLAFAAILIIWGLNFIFVGTAVKYSPPVWLSFLRAFSGFGGALILLLAFRTKGNLTFRQKLVAFLLGMPGTGIFFAFWMIGELTVPPGEVSVMIYTFPIWTLFLSIPILGDWPSPLKIGASFLGFAGVALVARIGTETFAGSAIAIALLVTAGFSFALDTVLFKRLFKGEQLVRANVWQLGGASVFLLIWALLSEPIQKIEWTYQLVGSIAWIGVLGTALVYVLWFTLLSRYNAASFAAYAFLVVMVALAASFLIFGERIDALQMVGVVALMISIYLVNKSDEERKPERKKVQEKSASDSEKRF
ncbi:MAG: DMT family transporter [Nitrososphaerota archaeon]|nr:DMT family transporter [Nitrososphaerota archaeon]